MACVPGQASDGRCHVLYLQVESEFPDRRSCNSYQVVHLLYVC
jgi:hypothetical protein